MQVQLHIMVFFSYETFVLKLNARGGGGGHVLAVPISIAHVIRRDNDNPCKQFYKIDRKKLGRKSPIQFWSVQSIILV